MKEKKKRILSFAEHLAVQKEPRESTRYFIHSGKYTEKKHQERKNIR